MSREAPCSSGPDYGINGLHVGQLPSPAARFLCNPLISGNDGGHSIHLRELGRRGLRLHGHFEGTDDGVLAFSDDLPARLTLVEAAFGQRMRMMLDAYIAAAGIDAPPAEAAPAVDWRPAESGARLDLDAEGITSIIWSTGYGLDFGFLDIPVLDQWNYPHHSRGVTEVARPLRGRAPLAHPARLVDGGPGRRGRGVRGRAHRGAVTSRPGHRARASAAAAGSPRLVRGRSPAVWSGRRPPPGHRPCPGAGPAAPAASGAAEPRLMTLTSGCCRATAVFGTMATPIPTLTMAWASW